MKLLHEVGVHAAGLNSQRNIQEMMRKKGLNPAFYPPPKKLLSGRVIDRGPDFFALLTPFRRCILKGVTKKDL